MKIQAIYLNNVGPINNQKFDFYDDWNDNIFSRVLFSGPNGSGKSLIFRTIAEIWEVIGYWLDNRKNLPNKNSNKKWLQQWGGIAIILTELPDISTPVGLVFGKRAWFSKIRDQHPKTQWIGEVISDKRDELLFPQAKYVKWFNDWSEARKKLIISSQTANTPNIIYLDAEECRWVSPNRRVGKMLPEDSNLRWLFKYQASEDWQGQLEASLINLKVLELPKYHEVINHLNRYLYDKEISAEVKQLEGKNRLQVNIHKKRGQSHTLDMLSSGERQILLKLYLVSRWLEPGGIVMIDEPDHYLHPSIVPSFLAQLEAQVEEKKGQLLIASHSPDVWNRYETRDKRIKLGNN
jgi:predicted ATPase